MVAPSNKRFLLESDKAVANGLATLGSDSKVPDAQLPVRLGPTEMDGAYLKEFIVGSKYGTTLKPWGVGDDTVAIQNAVDAAAQAGGGRVIIPFTGAYVPKASQIILPKWVHLSGASWNSFGASGNVGRLQQLSGVNADFITFNDNGDTATRPFIGPQSITDLVIRGASGATAGHGISFRTPDGRTALIQDFSTFQRINARGFAGSGLYIKGGSPIIIEDVGTLWNGGYGIEIIDPWVDTNNYSVHHLVLSKISGDGNMGYLSDAGGATVYLKGQTASYGTTMRGIKSEYRIRPTSDSGDGVIMGNAYAVILEDCASQIDITGVTQIATGSQTRKPKADILVKGTIRPNLTWSAVGNRANHPLQTIGTAAPAVEDAVNNELHFESYGALGPLKDASVAGLTAGESTMRRREITSTGATQTAGTLRLTYFTAERTETITKVRTCSGSTAAIGTTLARVGIYEVAANGDLTLVASSANDTALWSAASTRYSKTLTAPFVKKWNQRYAVGTLVVGATTAPNLQGQTNLLAAECAEPPRLCGSVTAQTDLPATVTAASISDTTIQVYAALAP
jgi:hypothetical protein